MVAGFSQHIAVMQSLQIRLAPQEQLRVALRLPCVQTVIDVTQFQVAVLLHVPEVTQLVF